MVTINDLGIGAQVTFAPRTELGSGFVTGIASMREVRKSGGSWKETGATFPLRFVDENKLLVNIIRQEGGEPIWMAGLWTPDTKTQTGIRTIARAFDENKQAITQQVAWKIGDSMCPLADIALMKVNVEEDRCPWTLAELVSTIVMHAPDGRMGVFFDTRDDLHEKIWQPPSGSHGIDFMLGLSTTGEDLADLVKSVN